MSNFQDIFIKQQYNILEKNELYIKNTFIDIHSDNIIEKFYKMRKVKSLDDIFKKSSNNIITFSSINNTNIIKKKKKEKKKK
jgi:hypothetical protein